MNDVARKGKTPHITLRTDVVVVVSFVPQEGYLRILDVHPRSVHNGLSPVFPAQGCDVCPALEPLIGAAQGGIPRRDGGVEDRELPMPRYDRRRGSCVALGMGSRTAMKAMMTRSTGRGTYDETWRGGVEALGHSGGKSVLRVSFETKHYATLAHVVARRQTLGDFQTATT